MLDVRDLTGGYEDIKVLRGVTFHVDAGEIVTLLGPNGHGKSTLLKAVAGLHPATGGSVTFQGEDISRLATHRIVERGLSYIPEERHLFTDMTVLENLRLGAYARSARRNLDSNLEMVFEIFPRLKERHRQPCSTLSGGEGRMVALARGLMSGARMLLVDEPSIGLAPGMKKHVYAAIRRINVDSSITILLVEQEIEYALKLATRAYLLNKGRVVLERASEEADLTEIKEAYF